MKTRRRKRIIFFIVTILAGILIGIILGWEVIPIHRAVPKPENLRFDYQTDYVLMVAELYQAEGDLPQAETRLAFLGEENLHNLMQNAIAYAQEHQYASCDLASMLDLIADLTAQSSEVE